MRRRIGLGAWVVAIALAVEATGCTGGPVGTARANGGSQAVGAHPRSSTPAATAPIRVHLASAAQAPPCAQAVRSGDPDTLLSAFRAARLAGHGAAGCLSAAARKSFCDVVRCRPAALAASPGPICLYRCFGFRLVRYRVLWASPGRQGSQQIAARALLRRPGGKRLFTNEALTVADHGHRVRITAAATSS